MLPWQPMKTKTLQSPQAMVIVHKMILIVRRLISIILLSCKIMKHDKQLLIQLGNNIRTVRKSQNLSQEKLALQSNIDRTYIGGVERGERNISIINLCRIASTLKISPSVLLNNVEYTPEKNDL